VPVFLLRLVNDDELVFTFTFIIRQSQQITPTGTTGGDALGLADTVLNGLTHVYASTPREVENLVTREFHADPNLHKNSNVELVGDYSTEGSPSITFEWSWRWKPPKSAEDKGGGWRNSCSGCRGAIGSGTLILPHIRGADGGGCVQPLDCAALKTGRHPRSRPVRCITINPSARGARQDLAEPYQQIQLGYQSARSAGAGQDQQTGYHVDVGRTSHNASARHRR